MQAPGSNTWCGWADTAGRQPSGWVLSVIAHLSLPGSACPSLLNSRQMTRGESQAALLKLPALTLGHLHPEWPLSSQGTSSLRVLFLSNASESIERDLAIERESGKNICSTPFVKTYLLNTMAFALFFSCKVDCHSVPICFIFGTMKSILIVSVSCLNN